MNGSFITFHKYSYNSFVTPLFPGDLQSCIELNDLNNSLKARSPSQILALLLVNTGVVIISRNFSQSSYDFVQLHLKRIL